MIDEHVNNPKSPKFHVRKYLETIKRELPGRIVIDVPAGNGVTSELLLGYGARVEPFDLFPEYFMLKEIECRRSDVSEGIPVQDGHADMLVCQEGIEHFSDQLKAFKEFNRVLKPGGKLLVTTPSYSNLASRLSYLLFESETSKHMPPNEIDDIWMSDQSVGSEIYHGHIFLIGLQKLRVMAKLSGFDISEIRYTRLSKGSLVLLPIFYPFIFISSYARYYRNMRKHQEIAVSFKKKVYREQLNINISIKNLVDHHIFIIFEKKQALTDLDFRLESMIKPFNKIM
jgi:SAM-dependent methyltransferase